MTALVAAFAEYMIKVIIFGAAAFAGIVCGKKFREKKNTQ